MPDPIIGANLMLGGANIANTLINQAFAEHNRKRNFYWNEKAADIADQRTRAQYQDLYSPQAQMEQYAAAGLSPSMMMSGGQSAVGGTPQGAQGGIQGPYPSGQLLDPNAAADIALKIAQKRNLDQDTISIELENEIKKLSNTTYARQWNLINNTSWGDESGVQSYSDLIKYCKDYNEFEDKVRDILHDTDQGELELYTQTEEGQKTLRDIYEANKKFDNEIAVLANSKENATLLLKIAQLLNDSKYPELSANAQKQQLQQVAESAELTTKEKKAFNNLIDRMGNGLFKDIAIVLLLTLGQWSHANINFGASQITSIKK